MKLLNLLLILFTAALVFAWTYYEIALNHVMDEAKPFHYFPLVWGSAALIVLIRCVKVDRTLAGAFRLSLAMPLKPYALGLVALLCGFTLHALAATTPAFDAGHLDMPFFLPWIFVPLHLLLVTWIVFGAKGWPTDKGLYLILLFHALNGAVFNTEYYLIAALCGITLLEVVIENRGKWSLPPDFIGLPLLLLLLLVAISGWNAVNPVKAVPALVHVGVCAATLLILVSRPRAESFYVKTAAVLLFASSLVVIASAGLIAAIASVLGPLPPLSTRLSIFYQHPNFLAPYLAMVALLDLGVILAMKRKAMRLLFCAYLPVVLAALWLTDSRAGFLGLAAGLAVFLLLLVPFRRIVPAFVIRRKRLIFMAAGLAVVAASVIAIVQADRILEAINNSTRLSRGLDYRVDAWSNSVEVIKDHPVTGLGLDTFFSKKKFPPGSKFAHESTAPHPHNLLLYIAQSTGIPALLVFLVLLLGYVNAALALLQNVESRPVRMLTVAGLSAVAALLASGMLDLGLSLRTLFPGPLWFFMGLTASMYNMNLSPRIRTVKPGLVLAVLVAAALVPATVRPVWSRMLLKSVVLSGPHATVAERIERCRRSVAADPTYEAAREFLLRQYLKEDRIEEAMLLVKELMALQPENAALYAKMGELLLQADRVEEARAMYLRAVETDHGSSNLPSYYAGLITAEAQLGAKETAEHLKAAIKRDIVVINLLDWEMGLSLEAVLDDMVKELKASARQGIPQDRFHWFSLVNAYINAELHASALALLDEIPSVLGEAERGTAFFFKALCAQKMGDLDQARAFIVEAERLGEATNPAAVRHFASFKAELSGAKESLAGLREALSRLRDFRISDITYIKITDSLLEQLEGGDRIEPLEIRLFFCPERRARIPFLVDLAEACETAGRNGDATRIAADTLSLVAKTHKRFYDLEEAKIRTEIERLAQIEAGHGLHSSNAARILFQYHYLMRCREPERARIVLDTALMDESHNIWLLELMARCCQALDDLPGMEDTYKKIALAFNVKGVNLEERSNGLLAFYYEDQRNTDLLLQIVLAKSYRYKIDEAMNILEIAMQRFPGDPRLPLLAARVQRLDHEPEEARRYLEKALHIEPGYIPAQMALERMEAP